MLIQYARISKADLNESNLEVLKMEITFSPRKIARFFLIIVLILVIGHTVGMFFRWVLGHGSVHGLVRLFDLNAERNLPTLYATVSMVVCAALLGLISLAKRKTRQPYVFHWLGLGFIFLFLAVDEFVELHEKLHAPMVKLLDLHGLLFVGWVVPYAAACLILFAIYLKFIWNLPRRTSIHFLLAGFVYMVGVMGIEAVSGMYLELYGSDVIYALTYTLEEILEMTGILIFIYALTSYIDIELQGLRIGITSQPEIIPKTQNEKLSENKSSAPIGVKIHAKIFG